MASISTHSWFSVATGVGCCFGAGSLGGRHWPAGAGWLRLSPGISGSPIEVSAVAIGRGGGVHCPPCIPGILSGGSRQSHRWQHQNRAAGATVPACHRARPRVFRPKAHGRCGDLVGGRGRTAGNLLRAILSATRRRCLDTAADLLLHGGLRQAYRLRIPSLRPVYADHAVPDHEVDGGEQSAAAPSLQRHGRRISGRRARLDRPQSLRPESLVRRHVGRAFAPSLPQHHGGAGRQHHHHGLDHPGDFGRRRGGVGLGGGAGQPWRPRPAHAVDRPHARRRGLPTAAGAVAALPPGHASVVRSQGDFRPPRHPARGARAAAGISQARGWAATHPRGAVRGRQLWLSQSAAGVA